MNRLLALCSHPYLCLSKGLFEKQDKYSLGPWYIFFIFVMMSLSLERLALAWEKRCRVMMWHSSALITKSDLCGSVSGLWKLSKLRTSSSQWVRPECSVNRKYRSFGVLFNNSSVGSFLLVCTFYVALCYCIMHFCNRPILWGRNHCFVPSGVQRTM